MKAITSCAYDVSLFDSYDSFTQFATGQSL